MKKRDVIYKDEGDVKLFPKKYLHVDQRKKTFIQEYNYYGCAYKHEIQGSSKLATFPKKIF